MEQNEQGGRAQGPPVRRSGPDIGHCASLASWRAVVGEEKVFGERCLVKYWNPSYASIKRMRRIEMHG